MDPSNLSASVAYIPRPGIVTNQRAPVLSQLRKHQPSQLAPYQPPSVGQLEQQEVDVEPLIAVDNPPPLAHAASIADTAQPAHVSPVIVEPINQQGNQQIGQNLVINSPPDGENVGINKSQ